VYIYLYRSVETSVKMVICTYIYLCVYSQGVIVVVLSCKSCCVKVYVLSRCS